MSSKLLKASEVSDKPEDDGNYRVELSEVDSFGRRVWKVVRDDETADKKKQEGDEDNEEEEEEEEDHQLNYLQKRNADLNLDSVIGKRSQVSRDADLRNEGVYKCQLCNIACKDSLTWLDHINGKKHNQLLGMTMKVERVGVDKVKEKFNLLKKKQTRPIENFQDFENKQKEEELQKIDKKKKKKKNKQLIISEVEGEDNDDMDEDERLMMEQMGLPVNLGGGKKN